MINFFVLFDNGIEPEVIQDYNIFESGTDVMAAVRIIFDINRRKQSVS